MPHKIGLATTSLHISAALYLIIGVLMLVLGTMMMLEEWDWNLLFFIFVILFCFAFSVGIEIVVYGLHRRKYWAWIAGLCIFGMYTPSLFLPLGALGLWGLLDSGSREEFGIGSRGR